MAQSPLSRVTDCEPFRISPKTKRWIASAFLAVPLGLIATAISDSDVVSDTFRYVIAPGTMLAVRLVKVEPSHRGLGIFLDVMSAYAKIMEAGFMMNAIFYGLLVFGIMTLVSATKPERR